MPTTPMAMAIGRRRKASTIMSARPTSDSVMRSGGGLRGARRARREDLEDVHAAGECDHRGHEIDERPDRNAQHVGGVAVPGDLARLDPRLPREEEHDGGA